MHPRSLNAKFLLCVTFILCAVPSAFAASGEVQDAADQYCACVKPIRAKANDMSHSVQSGNVEALQTLVQEMQQRAAATQRCFTDLEEKHGHLRKDPEKEQQVMAAIDKQCPDPNKGANPLGALQMYKGAGQG